jgi:hypothetical protein
VIRRICLGLAAGGAIFASAAVCLVALAFALYALVLPRIGPAGAAAVVAAAAAIAVSLAALIISLAARPSRIRKAAASGPLDRIAAFVRAQPVLAIAASLAAGFLAVRNPKYLGDTLRSFLAENPDRRRR